MTPRRPTPHRSPAFCAPLVGVLAVMGIVGCTDPPATAPDGARKDVAVEVGDLGGDVLADVPDASVDTGSDRADARLDQSTDGTLDGLDPFAPEDIPASYDIQLDRSWDALPIGTLVPLDVSALTADRPPPDVAGIPCVAGTVEDCSCIDGRAGSQVCEHRRVFSECICTAPSPPPFALPPRLVFPLSGTRVTSQRPTMRWVLPEGVTRARVELCADRPCARMLAQQDLTGTSWRPTSRLAPGVVFWRVRGLDAAGTVIWTSATWLFQVRARDAAVDTAYGRIRDFNGDGYDDLVIPQRRGAEVAVELHVFFGSPQGIGAQPELILRTPTTEPTRALTENYIVADFTGDGMADLWAYDAPADLRERSSDSAVWNSYLYEGHRVHPLARRIARMRFSRSLRTSRIHVADHDADGFLDLGNAGILYRGGPDGLNETPLLGSAMDREERIAAVADTNGDGFVEYIVDHGHYRSSYGRLPAFPTEGWHLPAVSWFSPGFDPYCLTLAGDMNGDQRADLLGYCWTPGWDAPLSSYVSIFPLFGREGGPILGALQLTMIPRQEPMIANGSSGDFNGDGLVDHLLHVQRGGISWIHGTAASAQLPLPINLAIEAFELGATGGDHNGDGFDDVVLVARASGVRAVIIVDGAPIWSGRYTSRLVDYEVLSLDF